ncbi:unnamed protein product [Ectocarpus sp. 12 AP-2014]
MDMYHFACFCSSGHSSLTEASLFPRFLLRDTQGGRRYITAHARGPLSSRGACAFRAKLKKKLALYPGDVFRAKNAFARNMKKCFA